MAFARGDNKRRLSAGLSLGEIGSAANSCVARFRRADADFAVGLLPQRRELCDRVVAADHARVVPSRRTGARDEHPRRVRPVLAELACGEFGLRWQQALETGGVLVGDEIRVSADLSAVCIRQGGT
jgi:hypothetical protein